MVTWITSSASSFRTLKRIMPQRLLQAAVNVMLSLCFIKLHADVQTISVVSFIEILSPAKWSGSATSPVNIVKKGRISYPDGNQIPISCHQVRRLVTVITELSLRLIGHYPAHTTTNTFSFQWSGDFTNEDDEMLTRRNEVQIPKHQKLQHYICPLNHRLRQKQQCSKKQYFSTSYWTPNTQCPVTCSLPPASAFERLHSCTGELDLLSPCVHQTQSRSTRAQDPG